MVDRDRDARQRVVDPRCRTGRAPAPRGVARAPGGRAGLRPHRGRLHLGRHGVGQPRHRGTLPGAAGGDRPHRNRGSHGRAPRDDGHVAWLHAHEVADLEWVGVDREARVDLDAVGSAVGGGDAAVATLLAANNEVGTLQPVVAASAACVEAGVPLHIDAVGAFGHVPLSFRALRADSGARSAGVVALSVAAHKLGGPVGVGALVVAREAQVRAAAARRRAAARDPVGHAGCRGRRGVRRRGGARGGRARIGGRADRRAAGPARSGSASGGSPTSASPPPAPTGSPGMCTRSSRALRATRSSCCWMPPGSRSRRVRRARRACPSRRTSCARWGWATRRPAAPCGSRSGAPRPMPTSTR